jgi:hypothetical protein
MMRHAVVAIAGIAALSACASTPQEALPPVEATVVISSECQQGLSVMRAFMASHSGPLDDEVKAYLREEANKAYETCSVQEFRTFMKTDLTPWADGLSQAPQTSEGSAPSTSAGLP